RMRLPRKTRASNGDVSAVCPARNCASRARSTFPGLLMRGKVILVLVRPELSRLAGRTENRTPLRHHGFAQNRAADAAGEPRPAVHHEPFVIVALAAVRLAVIGERRPLVFDALAQYRAHGLEQEKFFRGFEVLDLAGR